MWYTSMFPCTFINHYSQNDFIKLFSSQKVNISQGLQRKKRHEIFLYGTSIILDDSRDFPTF